MRAVSLYDVVEAVIEAPSDVSPETSLARCFLTYIRRCVPRIPTALVAAVHLEQYGVLTVEDWHMALTGSDVPGSFQATDLPSAFVQFVRVVTPGYSTVVCGQPFAQCHHDGLTKYSCHCADHLSTRILPVMRRVWPRRTYDYADACTTAGHIRRSTHMIS